MYYFNSNNPVTATTTTTTTPYGGGSSSSEHDHNGPLFSQPYNPSSSSSVNNGVAAPTDFSQEIDFSSYDPTHAALFNDALFDTSNSNQVHNWEHYNGGVMDPQEAILLSDPNFLRQHQLLQEQQRDMHNHHHRLLHGEEDEHKQQQQQQQQQQVSNLTAMFDHNIVKQEAETVRQVPVKSEPQDAVAFEQEEERRIQKKGNNRKQHVMVKEESNKIDHQRRFNELQARFRVNYTRKPTIPQQPNVKSSNINSTTTTTSLSSNTTTTNTTTTTPNSIYNDNTANNTTNTATNNSNINIHHAKSTSISPHPKPAASFEEKVTVTTPTVAPVAIGGLAMSTNTTNNEENIENTLSSSFPSRTMPIQIQRVARNNGSQPFDADSHQKQLDSQLDKVDFDDITVSELKEMLRQRGKPATGKKAVLLQRLLEERDLARGGRSAGGSSYGRVASNRHSQPLPFSRSVNDAPQRPRSFQGSTISSSPVMIQQSSAAAAAAAVASNSSSCSYTGGMSSPSSPGSFLPGSPSGSLHRSIANMHIGSPPAISRRYSPYSPRLSSSPKPSHQEYYSSSVPLHTNTTTTTTIGGGSLSSSPVNNTNNNTTSSPVMPKNNNMMLSLSYSANARPGRYYNNPKTYKPFTSSALATPDREEDINPFDSYYGGGGDVAPPPIIKEEDHNMLNNGNNNSNNMDWLDVNAFDMLLQQQQQQQTSQEDFVSDVPQLTDEQLLALLNGQPLPNNNVFDFKSGETTTTTTTTNFHSQPYYHRHHQ